MQQLIKFPHIEQFKNILKNIKSNADYHQVPTPIVEFTGTVKLHGTNATVVQDAEENIWHQSRERIITPTDDNAGFSMWASGKEPLFAKIFTYIRSTNLCGTKKIQLYGEWCGSNIQKGVGICNLPKMFVIFAIRISDDAECVDWMPANEVKAILDKFVSAKDNLYHIYQFPTYKVTVDPLRPEIAQNKIVELTMQVEQQCPVASVLLPIPHPENMIGEGIVWTCTTRHPVVNLRGIMFKSKGSIHSSTKVKTIVPIDEEKVNNVREFINATVTTNRLEQGLTKLREMGLDSDDVKNMGEYLRWITNDVLREEANLLVESQLDVMAVKKQIATTARQYFLNRGV